MSVRAKRCAMRLQSGPMTTDDFCTRASLALGGHGWITRIARISGVHYATAKRWASGELPVPQYAATIVELLEKAPEEGRAAHVAKARRHIGGTETASA